jgi:hypothetical protein
MSEDYFVWVSHNGEFNVARRADKDFVCVCGHGDAARDYANMIAKALNEQSRPC